MIRKTAHLILGLGFATMSPAIASPLVSGDHDNNAPSVNSVAFTYLMAHGVDVRAFDRSEIADYGRVALVYLYTDIPDPKDSPFNGTVKISPFVYVYKSTMSVIGYSITDYTNISTYFSYFVDIHTIDNDILSRAVRYVSTFDEIYRNFSTDFLIEKHSISARDLGDMLIIDIHYHDTRAGQIYDGAHFEVFVLKGTGDILGHTPTIE
jgi:hypothetical protein